MKRLMVFMVIVVISLSLVGWRSKSSQEIDLSSQSFEDILKAANGVTVNFYGWGGDEKINTWLDTYVAGNLKERYNITLNRVPMDIQDILNKLLGEKQLNSANGTIDILWLNGENFFTAKTNGLLFGPFTEFLPNYQRYVDTDSLEVKYDFGFPVEGYEAPYGKAQFVMICNGGLVAQAPADHKELLAFVKKNPGKFTYPAPPDFHGSAFVRNIILDVVGYETFIGMEPNKEAVATAIAPAISYLKELKPYLWRQGKTYPATGALLDNMFADGEVAFTMNYNPNAVAAKIETGQFPKTSKAFVFKNGTVGNTHFLGVPFNSRNKAAALVAIDFILSAEAQTSKYQPSNWGDLPVVDYRKLSSEEKKSLNAVPQGKGTVPTSELLQHRVPELPARLVPIVEEIWMETIPVGE